MRSLAISLELRGRSAASIDELATVPGPDSAVEVRRALIQAALLADVPGSAEFPAKTLQEGLTADAILRCPDPVGVLREVAIVDVDSPRDTGISSTRSEVPPSDDQQKRASPGHIPRAVHRHRLGRA
jgi:hypothetical protein